MLRWGDEEGDGEEYYVGKAVENHIAMSVARERPSYHIFGADWFEQTLASIYAI